MDRLRKQEEREQEGQELLQHIKQVQKEEAENNIKRKKQQLELLDVIYDANRKAIQNKNAKIQAEKDEEERIEKYRIEKAEKDAAYREEQE